MTYGAIGAIGIAVNVDGQQSRAERRGQSYAIHSRLAGQVRFVGMMPRLGFVVLTKADLILWALAPVTMGILAWLLVRPVVVVAIEGVPDRKFAMHIAYMGENPTDLTFCYSGATRSGCPDFTGEPGYNQTSRAFIGTAACEAAESVVIAASAGRFYQFICVPIP